ncbi:hypothetical protein BsWGS_08295 [Bradybaena similaris]
MKSLNMTLQLSAEKTYLERNLDQMFVLFMAMLIQMMQFGFAFVEAGVVRSKNVTNIMMKNLLDVFVAGIAYWCLGFAFAYGPGNSFIGWEHWALSDLPDVGLAFFLFQFVISATSSTIVSGAVAERCEMVAYFAYSFFITGFIYPVVSRWVWCADGWLNKGHYYEINGVTQKIHFYDFAGSGAVHLVGGTASFFGALILGPRLGRFHHETNTVIHLRGHSAPMTAFGTFILLVGFLAFNGGSQLSITNPGDGESVGLSMVNTVISASTAGYASVIIRRAGILGRHWSLIYTVNGAIAGMVAICAGCNAVRPWGAAAVGVGAGVTFNFVSWLMLKAKIDDPADAVAVHFGGGVWGLLAVAFLKYDTGILTSWDRRSGLILAWQLVGISAIIAWVGCLSALMFLILKLTGYFRISEEMERKGVDVPKHGGPAYPPESYGHGYVEQITEVLQNGQLSTSNIGYDNYETRDGSDVGLYESPEVKVMKHLQVRSVSELVMAPPSNESQVNPSSQSNDAFEDDR